MQFFYYPALEREVCVMSEKNICEEGIPISATKRNLLYFQQSSDEDFFVVSGIGLPVSTSTHQQ